MGDFFFPEDSPSPIFTTFSCITNVVGLIWSAINIGMYGAGCAERNWTWLLLAILSFVVNIGFAVYLYMRFTIKVRDPNSNSVGDAAYKVLMYDWGVLAYFFFLIWLVVWMAIAGSRAPDDSCAAQNIRMLGLLVFYICGGVAMCILSLFTECCRNPRWKQRQEEQRRAEQRRREELQRQQQPGPVDTVVGAFRNLFGGGAPPPQQQPRHAPNEPYQQPPPSTNPNYRA
jgi:hypothetical protein